MAWCLLSVHLFLPSFPWPQLPGLGKRRPGDGSVMLCALVSSAGCSSLDHQAVLITSTWVMLAALKVRAGASAQCSSHEPEVLGVPNRSLRLPRGQGHASQAPRSATIPQVASLVLPPSSLQERENSSSGQTPLQPPSALWGTCRSVCGTCV